MMNYAEAHAAVLSGEKICREGWNGANQFVFVFEAGDGAQPCLALRNAQGLLQPGWVPSQGDMFGKDWKIYVS